MGECRASAQIIFPESGRDLGHVTPTIFLAYNRYDTIRYDTRVLTWTQKLSVNIIFKTTSNLVCDFVRRMPSECTNSDNDHLKAITNDHMGKR